MVPPGPAREGGQKWVATGEKKNRKWNLFVYTRLCADGSMLARVLCAGCGALLAASGQLNRPLTLTIGDGEGYYRTNITGSIILYILSL